MRLWRTIPYCDGQNAEREGSHSHQNYQCASPEAEAKNVQGAQCGQKTNASMATNPTKILAIVPHPFGSVAQMVLNLGPHIHEQLAQLFRKFANIRIHQRRKNLAGLSFELTDAGK